MKNSTYFNNNKLNQEKEDNKQTIKDKKIILQRINQNKIT